MDCEHTQQKHVDGEWLCRSCSAVIELEPFDPSKIKDIKVNGLVALKMFRDYGKSEQRMTEENISRFRKEKGYDPVPVDKGRWI